ncbi:hypothetical protein DVH05_004908 [Phytophthora capsici]|nr:hypothetical protein DVH05_004908 [Phytophthora capsici]
MIITIAVVAHVTKMTVYRSETMREVVARFSPNLDARLVEATIVSRPARPLYQMDEAFTNIQTGENGVEVKMFPMNDTINKLTPHPGGIDLIFDIPQRAENPNRVQYAKEKRDVGLDLHHTATFWFTT